jgi:hypothetical protein
MHVLAILLRQRSLSNGDGCYEQCARLYRRTLFKQQRDEHEECHQHPHQYSGAAEAAKKVFHVFPPFFMYKANFPSGPAVFLPDKTKARTPVPAER